jgi:hypothetical protein
MLLEFKTVIGKEGIFKPTIRNESLHEISNEIADGIVNFVTFKNLTAKSTKFPHPTN